MCLGSNTTKHRLPAAPFVHCIHLLLIITFKFKLILTQLLITSKFVQNSFTFSMHLRGYVNHVSAPMFYEHNFFFFFCYGLLLLKTTSKCNPIYNNIKVCIIDMLFASPSTVTSNLPQFFFSFLLHSEFFFG